MTQQSVVPDRGWERRYMVGFFACLIVGVVIIVAAFEETIVPFWIWIALLALMISMTLFLSRAYTGYWMGILLDDRKKYSLSRLQMMMWTVIILSSFVAAVLANVQLKLLVYVSGAGKPAQVLFAPVGSIVSDVLLEIGVIDKDRAVMDGVDLSSLKLAEPLRDGEQIYVPLTGETTPNNGLPDSTDNNSQPLGTPLAVEIPSEVWLLLGISTTSLVASPLIKGQKKNKIKTNESSTEAGFSDLFKGEEGINYTHLDLAKVQLFYFTIIVIGAYMIAVANMFLKSQNAITSLPALDGGVVAMLGVSHAGYLTNKAVPRQEGESADDDMGSGAGGDGNPGEQPDPATQTDNTIGGVR